MKVLWVGDAGINSGFSVVTSNITKYFNPDNLVIFGIGYKGIPVNESNFKVYPAGTDNLYGFNILKDIIIKETPDVILLFNDLHIIIKYLEVLLDVDSRKVVFFPVNLFPLDRDEVLKLSLFGVEEVITYTEYSKSKILEINPNLNVTVVYHGVDLTTYFPVTNINKGTMFENLFIVGNVNSNTQRKRLDLFIKAFAKFAINKDDVYCFIHSSNTDFGYNLKDLASRLDITDKLVLSNKILDDERMNLLYNMFDVCCSTTCGEGFGLSGVEAAACGKPLLLPALGNLKDIWGDSVTYSTVNNDTETTFPDTYESQVINSNDFVFKLNKLYSDKYYRLNMGKRAYDKIHEERFNWNTVSGKVFEVINRANKNNLKYLG